METAKKNIQSLMTPKAKILLHENNMFKVNKQLQSKLIRIQFPVPLLEEVVKREKIASDRSAAVDAALVRIMKSRQKMLVQDLRLEVVTQMQNFKPDDALIKKRIQAMVEREFMDYDKSNKNMLIYLA